jgi:hypothetical protein
MTSVESHESGRPIIYSEKLAEWMMDYWMVLPLTVTMGHNNPLIRVSGVLWMFLWFVPAGIPWMFLMVPVLFAILLESTWKEST